MDNLLVQQANSACGQALGNLRSLLETEVAHKNCTLRFPAIDMDLLKK
jgi:hypothetical protein